MGTETIPDRSGGQTILAEWFNLLKRVLAGDIVPRNTSGVATNLGGNIGSDNYRFSKSYINIMNVGTAGSLKTIEEDGNDIVFKFNNVEKGAMKANGLDQQISASSGSFSGSGDITNLSVTITTRGRPVYIGLIHGGGGTFSDSISFSGSIYRFYRDTTAITNSSPSLGGIYPVSILWHIDTPSAGTYTYKLNVSGSETVFNAKLIAYEL
jgi:hypothetical protein